MAASRQGFGIDGVTGRRRVHGPLLRLRAAAGADAVAGLPPSPGGAGQAIEDAAALAVCLATGPWDPPAALARYERVRLPRASRVQEASRGRIAHHHLPDGPEQVARDAAFAGED